MTHFLSGKKMVANLHLNLQNGVNKALNMLESSMSSLGRYPLSALPHNPGFHLLSLETSDHAGQEVSASTLQGIEGVFKELRGWREFMWWEY